MLRVSSIVLGLAVFSWPLVRGEDELAKLLASDGSVEDRFGSSVGVSGATALIGAPDDDDKGADSRSAYVVAVGGPSCTRGLDGDVDLSDLAALLAVYGTSCP